MVGRRATLRVDVLQLGQRAMQRLAVAAATVVLAACATQDVARNASSERGAAGERVLVPLQVITGGRLAPGLDASGLPAQRSPAALTSFIHPAAVALAGGDFYIADTGARRVYRLDTALATMAAVPGAPVALGTRLAVGDDLSLYVLDPAQRRVLRLSRQARPLASYSDGANLVRPVALAVDDAHGEVFVADQVLNLLVAFHALGNAREIISMRGDERNRVMNIAAFALGAGAIHISDALCRCVQVVDRAGYARASFGHGDLGQPGAIAIDRHGRVLVTDQFHNSIKIFAAGRLVHEVAGRALGVVQITDLAVREDRLVVADGPGARVVVLRIAAPQGTH